MHSSVIQISKSALKNNIDIIKSLISKSVTLSSVIKGNAYGHSIAQMVPLLQEFNVNHFSVYSSFEAKKAFEVAKKDFTILIMGDINCNDEDWIIDNGIDFFVFNLARLKQMLSKAMKKKQVLNIHIEIETGMNRTGFNQKDWNDVIQLVKTHKEFIKVKGLCTHFAGAESLNNYVRVKQQQIVFNKAIKFFKSHEIIAEKIHCSCSASVLAFPTKNYDMVRVGILQYGLWPSRESFIKYISKYNIDKNPLKPVLSWKSYIMDVKLVSKGEFIGYGSSFLAENETKVASVPIGYGYGYSRSLSNLGRVIINNNRYSVIGTINMNMLLIDISSSDSIAINDEVILIGSSTDLDIPLSSFCNNTDQLNYEVLSRIDKDIPRIITI
ncbi:MAG: alanine racemase [Lutibacter sp.]|uniref:alanine racemase n=1 Tax=Lutibacter sp. TaxID=1925666 RepID=UPI0018518878|nr:alanine racemase [Lutibacter sp.]MBT8316031.1 alanine racemase [Lutibacter sp.]NNJ56891.1 alanine racemase [Lutibacter sp.]